jgi:aromatic-L-amino-acid decarboxylase
VNEKAEFCQVAGGKMWCRHRLSKSPAPTLLLIHGLGDCHQSFDQAFESPAMRDFNLLAPDLLGYGKSVDDVGCDYSFSAHLERLTAMVDEYVKQSRDVFVIGHSLGGDLATHLVSSRNNTRFSGLVNIEGNLTPGDLFISHDAVAAESRGDFCRWFQQDFRQQRVLQQWARRWPSCQRYNDALEVCRPHAFLANARELCQRNQQVPGDLESETGRVFRLLELPKMFCRGSEALCGETEQLLAERDADDRELPTQRFEEAFHWVMVDQHEKFYSWLARFVGTQPPEASELELSARCFQRRVDQATRHITRFLDRGLNADHAAAIAVTQPPAYEPPPQQGEDFEALLRELFEERIPDSINTAGPNYFAYVPGGGLLHAAIADLIANSVNRYVSLRKMAPSLAMLEETVVRWFCDIVGYPQQAFGFLTSGGSVANLAAIVTARTWASDQRRLSRGVIYLSDQVHHSIEKAAGIAGFAVEDEDDPDYCIRRIATDRDYRIDIAQLKHQVEADRAQQLRPFLLIGSAGTTNTGAVDPLDQLAEFAAQQELWFHVDAAYGGFFALTDQGARCLRGMERADSLTLDPHKSLFLPYGTGCLLVRDPAHLERAFQKKSDYIQVDDQTGPREGPFNFCDISPELSRDFRGLRVWLPIKMHGLRVFSETLDEKLRLAQTMSAQLKSMRHFQIVAEPQLSILAFRLVPDNRSLTSRQLDALNRAFVEEVNAHRRSYLQPTELHNNTTIRFCILSLRTHDAHLRSCLEEMRRARDVVLDRLPAG